MHNDKLYIPHIIYNLNVCLLIASTEVWRVNAELSSFRLGQFLIFGFSDLPGNVLYWKPTPQKGGKNLAP